jgi:hypothetical protein
MKSIEARLMALVFLWNDPLPSVRVKGIALKEIYRIAEINLTEEENLEIESYLDHYQNSPDYHISDDIVNDFKLKKGKLTK